MGQKKKPSRRDFLKGAILAGAGLLLGNRMRACPGVSDTIAQGATPSPRAYLPLVMKEATPTATPTSTPTATPTSTPTTIPPAPGSPKVIHVHSTEATYWDFGNDYYGDYVRQDVVNNMVDRGVMELTGASTVAEAWRVLIPDYAPGKAIAIKVNFNNAHWSCEETDTDIDALIHPVNAIVRGLKLIGVAEADIWVYDATRPIPNRFVSGCLYPGLQYFASRCRAEATFDSDDPNAGVHFSPPGGIPAPADQKITDVLINATYLINIPIMKMHGLTEVTLGFKNHLGTVYDPSDLHDHIGLWKPYYSSTYNPMVEIYSNPHIRYKTRLVVGDGLFGNRRDNVSAPESWTTFGGAPNSLFFAVDPVAVDCVMCDFLDAEAGIDDRAYEHLQVAEEAGLGTYERGDPWGSGYSHIDYRYVEL